LTLAAEHGALTAPYVNSLQETVVKRRLGEANASLPPQCQREQNQHLNLIMIQRQLRAQFAKKHYDMATKEVYGENHEHTRGVATLMSGLLPLNTYFRRKRQNKRESKTLEKNWRERQGVRDGVKRRNTMAFSKAALGHRDEFLRFHKAKRADCAKLGRAVRQQLESLESKKEKEEGKAEARRLQALKENDMESYMKLVQETKNSRLKHLLDQTDDYISTINRMVQAQRMQSDGDEVDVKDTEKVEVDAKVKTEVATEKHEASTSQIEDSAKVVEPSTKNDVSLTESGLQLSKSYYDNTHQKTEIVVQPRMLQGGDLKEYQIAGLQWMVSLYNNNLNGILADDMGLGKTIQTLALLSYVMEFKHNNGPFLVVVPLSTLSNWVNEAEKWTPTMIKVIYRGTPTVRKQIFKDEVEPGHFNTLFTSYEYIMKDKSVLKKIFWQYIIVDEGHRMKNANSKFAQTLGTSYKSKNRILLTGTPLQNNLPELWALLNFLLPSIFSSVDTFDQWFNQPFASFRQQQVNTQSTDEGGSDVAQLSQEERLLIVHRLHEVLRPFMLRRVKDQVLDQLPEKVETVLRCNLSQWQRTLYRLIHRKSLATVKDAVGNVSSVYGSGLNNVIMQLRKICNHPYLFLNDYSVDDDMIRASGKFELLDRMLPKLKRAGHRVLMFSQMTQVMTILERYFEYKRFSFLRLDGSTPADEREKRMYTFNDPDSPFFIFLLSTRAGGLGLNLATADVVILFDSDWNPMMDAQAQDRAHRIGQRNEVRVFRLVTTSIMESKILARATDKRNLNDLVVEAGKFNDGNAKQDAKASESAEHDKKAMMEALLKEYAEGGDFEEEGEEEGLVPDDEQINDMMSVNEKEFALYQEIDKKRLERMRRNWADQCFRLKKAYEKGTLPPSLMTNDLVPQWIRQPSAWLAKHTQLYLMFEEFDKQRVQGHDVELRILDTGDSDSGSGAIWDSYAENATVALQDIGERKRKSVMYDDGLTETQFMNLVEKEENKKEAERASQAQLTMSKRKTKTKMPVSALDPVLSKGIIKVLNELCKTLDETGQYLLYGLFIEKPDKKIFPDYYQIVANPIAMKTIVASLKKGKYLSLEEVKGDMDLLCKNASTYNMEGSVVHNASLTLRDDFFNRLQSLQQNLEGATGELDLRNKRGKGSSALGQGSSSSDLAQSYPIQDTAHSNSATSVPSSAAPSLKMTLPSSLFKSQQKRQLNQTIPDSVNNSHDNNEDSGASVPSKKVKIVM
jgi:SNF2 family DNA or RNA helicase